ncbi:hypothetical protein JMUB5056_1903 [Leptotrichia hongkongensis]|uniref:Uncharacterized protein n=1 Tax=Leptotrichia hongkongensis TaxID=554406 RepID=A0A510LB29_9FUSO|nr:DUF2278 family protein [Leptotrichia hongkongensis]BBM60301.1 hypothetical protein JMUB5056_1903 [Leptotrichia hongkongensis]
MEKYVMFRGKVIDKWYDFDKRAHYHIVAMDDEEKRFDLAVNIGSIYEKMNEIVSSNLKVYYDESYSCRKGIVRKMLLQKNGITECHKDLYLDYIRMKLFPHEKMIQMKGFDVTSIYLTGIIEKNVVQAMNNDDYEVIAFGRLYANGKGLHDIHMNQESVDKFRKNDASYSDGGLFFRNRLDNKITAVFIAFITQSLNMPESV